MLASVFWRLIWKEYRTQRGLWLVLAASAVVLQLVIVGFTEPNDFDSLAAQNGLCHAWAGCRLTVVVQGGQFCWVLDFQHSI